MKLVSLTFGLVGCLMASVSAGSTPPRMSEAEGAAPERHCAGPVTITRQSDVTSVGAFCQVIDGDLRIAGTDVTNLDALEGLRSVRYLVVVNNPKLESVTGLRGLRSARGVNFIENPALRSLEGLSGITEVDAAVMTSNGITSLHGLEGLRVARDVVIVGNRELRHMDGINGLHTVEHMEIAGNGAAAQDALVARAGG
jgi:hypothetical protein